MESIQLTTLLPAIPSEIYFAWLDSEEHSKFTGGIAVIDPEVGGVFDVWDGYITGKTLELEPDRRILQSWRTTEFPPGSPDSKLEVLIELRSGVTELTLNHSDIPDGQSEMYAQGWKEYYFAPMIEYFQHEK